MLYITDYEMTSFLELSPGGIAYVLENETTATINNTGVYANNIYGSLVSGTTVKGGTISGTTIVGPTVSGTTVKGGTISGTTIIGPTVSGTTVKGATIVGTTISGTTFKTPTLSATTIVGPKVSATTICGTTIYSSNGFYETSDERLKDFGEKIPVNFEKLSQLKKNYFKWKDSENKDLQIGVSAQEINELYPEIVSKGENGLTVAYDKLSVVALSAIDKLYEENKSLKERLNKLEQQIENIINNIK
jgi:hypothetical protein